MPFKGTASYPSSLAIATAIDSVGGKHNAFTSKDHTGYWVKVAANHLDLALEVVGELLLKAQLKEADIERERSVIIEEINMYEDEPQIKVGLVFDQLMFDGSGLAWDTAGYKETVSKLGREDFLKHYDRWYNPDNVVIGVVGKLQVTGNKLQALLEKNFNKGEERKGGGRRDYGLAEQTEPRIKVFYKETEQAHFHLGFPTIGWENPERYALNLMTVILGGNASSRLFNEIREKRGLAYYAQAGAEIYKETGVLAACEGVTVGKIEEAIKVTLNEFEKMAEGKVSSEEVVRAKEFLLGKVALDLEDSSAMANLIVRRRLLEDKRETVDQIMGHIRKIEKEQVIEIAKKVLDPKKVNLAVVGPYRDEEKFRSLIT
jgi:predicted Zn-dependent peptidase